MPIRSIRGSGHDDTFWYFVPLYDELTLFLMASSFLFLCAVTPELRSFLILQNPFKMIVLNQLYLMYVIFVIICLAIYIIFFMGWSISLVYVFTRLPKRDVYKWAMLLFAVLVTHGTSVAAAFHSIKQGFSWLLIFPIWNVISGLILLGYGAFQQIGIDDMPDDDAEPVEVILAVAVLGVLIWACQYKFKLHWAITYSICVSYSTFLVGFVFSLAEWAGLLKMEENVEEQVKGK